MFKNALVSVSDKTGLVEFLKPLVAQGLRVLSTGGTARHLRENGIPVVDVSEQTRFPEVMDGRVKTLHPYIHMCLLARHNNKDDHKILSEHGLEPIDLVIGNLYPFEKALGEGLSEFDLVEYIDIGGPSLLRAAAKNYERITVLCHPEDYSFVSQKKELTLDDRRRLASRVFAHVSAYDSMVAKTLGRDEGPREFSLGGYKVQNLRYGENPSQTAAWYRSVGAQHGIHQAQILQGKELSYNNLLDVEAAVSCLRLFEKDPAGVAVKHNNPCGVAVGESTFQAVERMLAADPVSVFGGIVAINRTIEEDAAKKLNEIFLECVVAPDFTEGALKTLAQKKNVRVLKWPDLMKSDLSMKLVTVSGGFLLQSSDQVEGEWSESWEIVGKAPTPEIKQDLLFAWKVCSQLKSNAIAIATKGQTVGLGMGQVNRVDAVEHAIGRMSRFHPKAERPVMASDAFFPFADSIEKAAQAGIHWVIQPGGSIKDEEVKARALDLNINMVLTGSRHFRH